MWYASIALNTPLERLFDYHVPDDFVPIVHRGSLVRVSFGTSQQMGIVVDLHQHTPDFQTKPISAILDPLRGISTLTALQLDLARWLSESTLTPIGMALWAFLPPQLAIKGKPISAKQVSMAHPLLSAQDLAQGKWTDKQRRILSYLLEQGSLPSLELQNATQCTRADLNKLAQKGALELNEQEIWRDPLAQRAYVPSLAHALTPDQIRAYAPIAKHLQSPPTETANRAFLLHGITGSGKTEIYLHAIAEALAQSKQAFFLVPEIALTPQTIRRVAQRFPQQVAVIHSGLSAGERFDAWRRARTGAVSVIVGTRSALFAPLPQVGVIVLDEEHDHSYKHSPPFNPPYYHARALAEHMGRLSGAVVILGSATPDLDSYQRAKTGALQLLELPARVFSEAGTAGQASLPPVQIVDMREELKAGNTSMFSRALHSALEATLARGEQAILFLNRRGQATYVFCRDCGAVSRCPRCDMPLTYHRHGEALLCHVCGHSEAPPQTCPACQSARIKYFGAGTQQLEEAVHQRYPQARLVRWDADTANKPEHHEDLLARFVAHEADILVGTQMVAKGLDLPLVTLVGIVSADHALALPDFRASERAFQVLTQVAGRAGRASRGGQVILQTYDPIHPAIRYAAQHDYGHFFAEERDNRRALGYPPFRRLVRLLIEQAHPTRAEEEAHKLAQRLQERIAFSTPDASLIGPAPCYYAKLDEQYRWHILLRARDPLAIVRPLLPLPKGWHMDLDAVEVL